MSRTQIIPTARWLVLFAATGFLGVALPEINYAQLPLPHLIILAAIAVVTLLPLARLNVQIPFLVSSLLYLAALLVPAFFAQYLSYLASYYLFTLIAFFSYFLWCNLARSGSAWVQKMVLLALSASGTILGMRTLYALATSSQDLMWIMQVRSVAVESLVSNNLAALLAPSIVATFGWFFELNPGAWARCLGIGAVVIQAAALIATASRGGAVACVVGLLILVAWSSSKALRFVALTATLTATLGLSYFAPQVLQFFVGRFDVFGTLSGRAYLWADAVEIVIHSPVFGVGLGNFTTDSLGSETFWTAHNILLQQLLNGGFVALTSYLLLWLLVVSNARAAFRSVTSPENRAWLKTVSCTLLVVWVHSMVEPALGSPLVDLIAWSLAGLFVSPITQQKDAAG